MHVRKNCQLPNAVVVSGALAVVALAYAGPAQALKLDTLNIPSDAAAWAQALQEGVAPGPDSLTQPATNFYESQIGQEMDPGLGPIGSFVPVVPVLTPLADIEDTTGEIRDGLVMSWNEADSGNPEILNVAQFVINDEAPGGSDLTGLHMKFTINPPPGIWDVSFELIDTEGDARGWFGMPGTNAWQTQQINFDVAGPQGLFTFFSEDPGFDIDSVVQFRFNESAQGGASASFPVDPALGTVTPWNSWDSVLVVPVPGTALILILGIAGLSVLTRRTR